MSFPESDVKQLVDVAGNTIEVGDWVTYPQMSGRSVQIVLGKLVAYNGKTAQIQRVEGARWSSGYQSTKHRDTRTGKNVRIWTSDWRHWEIRPQTTWKHCDTGEVLTEEEFRSRFRGDRRLPAHGSDFGKFEGTYNPGKLRDYIEEFKQPLKPVTIQNINNIVKVVPANGTS